ncbi:hypothetical protein [Actinomadura craniellae]|uniref:hypothetical protein n=1 Tax=Actinomadura craniellae TaxID=2231787 RepID=UPI001F43EEF3|nr:hypothetical protein [Actinomadura craniellae]
MGGRDWPRRVRAWLATTTVLALLGPPLGWWWAAIAPPVREIVLDGERFPADPESQAMIGTDGRYAALTLVAGLLSALVAYRVARRTDGRDHGPGTPGEDVPVRRPDTWKDVPVLLGLLAGGLLAAWLAWQAGHYAGLEEYQRALRAAADGDVVVAAVDLHARGLMVLWALAAVAGYGTLEAVFGRLDPGDGGDGGSGEPDQVGGGELDLQTAPPRRDVDGREP